MKKKTTNTTSETTPGETINDLKNATQKNDAVKKGYNEKNPTQPQGAFKPDSSSKKTS